MILLTKEFDDVDEWSDNGSREFDEYAEFDNEKYRNFDEVEEFHQDYAEFPMEDREDEGPPRKRDDKKDDSVVKNHSAHISATQVLATTVVALVVVTGIFIPVLENKDTMVYIDGSAMDGIVWYYVSMSYYDENIPYYAVLLDNGSIINQQVITEGYAEYKSTDFVEGHEYAVEVRSGSPPLYTVERKVISEPSSKVYVVLDHLNAANNSIDYGLTLYGTGATATVTLLDAQYNEVYTKSISEGYDSGIVENLSSGQTYYLDVANSTDTLLFEEVTIPT